MIADSLNYIIDFWKGTIAPNLTEVWLSTLEFWKWYGVDNVQAAPHGSAAITGLFLLITTGVALFKSLRMVSKALKLLSATISGAVNVAKTMTVFIQRKAVEVSTRTINAAFNGATYRGILDWFSVLDPNSKKRLLTQFEDGSTHLSDQRNRGISVIIVTLWSGSAFGYAVYAAGKSFPNSPVALPIIGVVGAILFGSMIMVLDRSIIAPFSHSGPSNSALAKAWSTMNGWERLERARFYLTPAFTFGARITISYYIAKFTALPFTMLILHGGIVDDQNAQLRNLREPVEQRIAKINADRTNFVQSKLSSPQCQAATAGVEQANNTIKSAHQRNR